jgi:hypothetical protein
MSQIPDMAPILTLDPLRGKTGAKRERGGARAGGQEAFVVRQSRGNEFRPEEEKIEEEKTPEIK